MRGTRRFQPATQLPSTILKVLIRGSSRILKATQTLFSSKEFVTTEAICFWLMAKVCELYDAPGTYQRCQKHRIRTYCTEYLTKQVTPPEKKKLHHTIQVSVKPTEHQVQDCISMLFNSFLSIIHLSETTGLVGWWKVREGSHCRTPRHSHPWNETLTYALWSSRQPIHKGYRSWKSCVWFIWYHSPYSTPAITTSPSSPIKVPPTSCTFIHRVCFLFRTLSVLLIHGPTVVKQLFYI